MNERDFMLRVEEYLDHSLSPEDRRALGAEVEANPERRRQFEQQARQHIRLHAQTSRIDFTESQHIAMMVMDIAEKHRDPNAFMDILRQRTWRERLRAILSGLRAGRGTSAYRQAKDELLRIFGPMTASMAVNLAVILVIALWMPFMTPTPPRQEGVAVTLRSEQPPMNLEPMVAVETSTAEQPTEHVIPLLLAGPIGCPAPSPEPGGPEQGTDTHREAEQSLASTTAGGEVGALRNAGLSIPTLAGRSTAGRRSILSQVPHAEATEDAVLKSLQWLKTSQRTDGSWAGQDPSAMTGLALLAFLAHGETPASVAYGDTVTQALKYLLARQTPQGAFSANVYAHAIATYAMAEAYTLTRILELRAPLEKGTRIILDGQQTTGGFDYNYRKSDRFDTSVTGWQVQALKAARLAGADSPGLEEGLTKASRFLANDAFSHDGSGFVYEGKPGIPASTGGRPSMTGVGTLCLQMLGQPACLPVKSGLRSLLRAELDWPENGKAGVYGGYYITQAKFQAGDKTDWSAWNRAMQHTLLAHQKKDGHWEQGDYDNGTHVYTTTLCTLMLEVYYRYLPTYAKRPESAPHDKSVPGDIAVDIK